MRIHIAAVGRMKHGPERELAERYLARAAQAGRGVGLTGFTLGELPESRAGDAGSRKREEAAALRAGLPEGILVALDEQGRSMTSGAFAGQIGRWRDDGRPAASFVIGGPDGLAPEVTAAADLVLGLSPLTWPHQLVRIMLAEQLYRAVTILAGHPYHRQ